MTIADITRAEFDQGIERAKETLDPKPQTGWNLLYCPSPFTADELECILALHDYAQWHELDGAVLMSVARMFQPLTLDEVLNF